MLKQVSDYKKFNQEICTSVRELLNTVAPGPPASIGQVVITCQVSQKYER